jgi:hypothetical protein
MKKQNSFDNEKKNIKIRRTEVIYYSKKKEEKNIKN